MQEACGVLHEGGGRADVPAGQHLDLWPVVPGHQQHLPGLRLHHPQLNTRNQAPTTHTSYLLVKWSGGDIKKDIIFTTVATDFVLVKI